MTASQEKRPWLDRPLFTGLPILTKETILFVLIILLAVFSRLYGLGDRVISHDENSHVYYSWLFASGQGYQHTPTTHGPLQFHVIALTYFFFGDNEFTARLPHALASILTIVLLYKWRQYLGRLGALVAAALMLVSPYMFYYGRYARNEAFVALFGVMTLYAILRQLETGKDRYLVLLTVATALHFTSKETSFIYTAQAMLFLAAALVLRLRRTKWKNASLASGFLIALSVGVFLTGAALGLAVINKAADSAIPGTGFLALGAVCAMLTAVFLLIAGYGWRELGRERSFGMLLLLGTFVLPQLAAFPIKALGWDPLAYAFDWPGWNWTALWAQGPFRTCVVLLPMIVLSFVTGLLWDRKRWLINASIFWGIFIFFYSSAFTNLLGIATGLVGSLGYWLQQQGVNRGGQPWYYYFLIQIPLYEFLPALGLWLAAWYGLRHRSPLPLHEQNPPPELSSEGNHTFALLFWWTISGLIAYTLSGEKMPWLTVHIALPMILLAGWGFGQLIEHLDWSFAKSHRLWPVSLTVVTIYICLARCLFMVSGTNPPFQGKTLDQLRSTGAFLLPAVVGLACLFGSVQSFKGWSGRNVKRLAGLLLAGMLFVLTGRVAARAAFHHPNDASEYLVYAHGASGVLTVMDEISRVSSRIYGETMMPIAYDRSEPDSGVAWPFLWYLRNYPRASAFYQVNDDLLSYPAVIADQRNAEAVANVLGPDYTRQEFTRMVWPNQDYFSLTWARIASALRDSAMRSALIKIWLNRDFSEYAMLTGDLHLTAVDWQPSDRMSLFVRRDLLNQIWEFPTYPATIVRPDPYAEGQVSLVADQVIGSAGNSNGQFSHPHGLAVAPDGSIFVADTDNHRIQHFSSSGTFLNAWGTYADGSDPNAPVEAAPIGTFNQPWAVAVSPDGQSVYVLDTWNHRIQKFTPHGDPLTMWGIGNYDPSTTEPFGLWGPRGIAIDPLGRVFVADTGNKRILVYDPDGGFIDQIGSGGMEVGFFDEPVGLAFDADGNLYIADTWNQRIQVFSQTSAGEDFLPVLQWDVQAWVGDSLDNKPYLAVDQDGHLFLTDPPLARVIEFTSTGSFVQTWGDYGTGADTFDLPSGIAVDNAGGVWVCDAGNDRILHFNIH